MTKYFERAFSLMVGEDKVLREILRTTLGMSLSSSLISLFLGVAIGVLIATHSFYGKKIVVGILKTLMGIPPVVAGLVVFILLSGTGPFGEYKLVYTVKAMVIAQIFLITPIIAGLTESYVEGIFPAIKASCKGLKLGWLKTQAITVNESKYQIISFYLTGFSRSIAEVGAVQLVGGNILHKTRVMTTAIITETNMGNFEYAIALGIILLLVSFVLTLTVSLIQEKQK